MFYSEELRKEARQLKRELLAAKQKKLENAAKQAEKNEGKGIYQAYIFPLVLIPSLHPELILLLFLLFNTFFGQLANKIKFLLGLFSFFGCAHGMRNSWAGDQTKLQQ